MAERAKSWIDMGGKRYKCPKCHEIFYNIDNRYEHCPKCGMMLDGIVGGYDLAQKYFSVENRTGR